MQTYCELGSFHVKSKNFHGDPPEIFIKLGENVVPWPKRTPTKSKFILVWFLSYGLSEFAPNPTF